MSRPPALILCAFAAILLGACATTTPAPPVSTDPAVVARCRNLMYVTRAPRGPPNWTLYENCLRGAPYTG